MVVVVAGAIHLVEALPAPMVAVVLDPGVTVAAFRRPILVVLVFVLAVCIHRVILLLLFVNGLALLCQSAQCIVVFDNFLVHQRTVGFRDYSLFACIHQIFSPLYLFQVLRDSQQDY